MHVPNKYSQKIQNCQHHTTVSTLCRWREPFTPTANRANISATPVAHLGRDNIMGILIQTLVSSRRRIHVRACIRIGIRICTVGMHMKITSMTVRITIGLSISIRCSSCICINIRTNILVSISVAACILIIINIIVYSSFCISSCLLPVFEYILCSVVVVYAWISVCALVLALASSFVVISLLLLLVPMTSAPVHMNRAQRLVTPPRTISKLHLLLRCSVAIGAAHSWHPISWEWIPYSGLSGSRLMIPWSIRFDSIWFSQSLNKLFSCTILTPEASRTKS